MGRNYLDLYYIQNFINKGNNKEGGLEIIAKKHTKSELYESLVKYRNLRDSEDLTDKFLKYIINFNSTRVILKGDTKINESLLGKEVYLYTGALLEKKKINEKMVGFRLCEFENKRKLRSKKKPVDRYAMRLRKTFVISEKVESLELTEEEIKEIAEEKEKENNKRKAKMEKVKYKIVKKKKTRRHR